MSHMQSSGLQSFLYSNLDWLSFRGCLAADWLNTGLITQINGPSTECLAKSRWISLINQSFQSARDVNTQQLWAGVCVCVWVQYEVCWVKTIWIMESWYSISWNVFASVQQRSQFRLEIYTFIRETLLCYKLGNVGSSIFGVWPILATENQDIYHEQNRWKAVSFYSFREVKS